MKHLTLNFFLFVSIIITVSFSAKTSFAQTNVNLPESLGKSLGIYKTNNAEKFIDFQYFQLKKNFSNQDTNNPSRDSEGKVIVDGELKTKKKNFKFNNAFVRIITIEDYEYY